jgi:hypothetical protein
MRQEALLPPKSFGARPYKCSCMPMAEACKVDEKAMSQNTWNSGGVLHLRFTLTTSSRVNKEMLHVDSLSMALPNVFIPRLLTPRMRSRRDTQCQRNSQMPIFPEAKNSLFLSYVTYDQHQQHTHARECGVSLLCISHGHIPLHHAIFSHGVDT